MLQEHQAQIQAREYTLAEILSGKKYEIDYFQREYKWRQINIEQMIYDLTESFLKNYQTGHVPNQVAGYKTYFMGSIVTCQRDGSESLVDGQQRITSLTLLIIYLYHRTKDQTGAENPLCRLIRSNSYGNYDYNLNIPERVKCMDELYNGNCDTGTDDNDSVRNMVERYHDIENLFPDEQIKDDALICFMYWLINKVIMVKISAISDENAYTIFETMNDRGLPLTPADMMKGYILSKFRTDQEEARRRIHSRWQKAMTKLNEFGACVESQFFHAWLRSQYATTIRSTEANSVNMDFENIGTRFHSWFRDNVVKDGPLKIAVGNDMERFMDKDFQFFLKAFLMLKEAEQNLTSGMEHIYYTNCCGIANSLSYPLMLAPLSCGDTDETIKEKMDMVARFLDLFYSMRCVHYHRSSHSSIRIKMYQLVLSIRNSSPEELRKQLIENEEKGTSFAEQLPQFRLNGQNRPFVKYFLSRLTSFIEEQSGMGNKFVHYMRNPDNRPYEVEHVWSDHFERHTDECTDTADFDNLRNNIGALVLLPNRNNQSYNAMDTAKKLPLYIKENLLAASLTEGTYEHNPAFTQFIRKRGLPFKAYQDIRKSDIRERCDLYARLAELVWSSSL